MFVLKFLVFDKIKPLINKSDYLNLKFIILNIIYVFIAACSF